MSLSGFPDLEGTTSARQSLHRLAKVVGAVRRGLESPHPKWWHISLRLQERGWTTSAMPSADGPIEMRFIADELCCILSRGGEQHAWVVNGTSVSELVAELDAVLREWTPAASGIEWPDDSNILLLNPAPVARLIEGYWQANSALSGLRDSLLGQRLGPVGPVQLWPHHFDLSVEWFGKELSGEDENSTAQIGFGFTAGDDEGGEPYFYANPWPFDERWLEEPLPPGAAWQQGEWTGSSLAYASVVQDPSALDEYYRAVFELTSPALRRNGAT